jgi:hypothetical protein
MPNPKEGYISVFKSKEGYIAVYKSTDEPILMKLKNQEIGIFFPIFDNPLDADRFGELNTDKDKYYVTGASIRLERIVF